MLKTFEQIDEEQKEMDIGLDPSIDPLTKDFLSFCSAKIAVGNQVLVNMRKAGMSDETINILAETIMLEMVKSYTDKWAKDRGI